MRKIFPIICFYSVFDSLIGRFVNIAYIRQDCDCYYEDEGLESNFPRTSIARVPSHSKIFYTIVFSLNDPLGSDPSGCQSNLFIFLFSSFDNLNLLLRQTHLHTLATFPTISSFLSYIVRALQVHITVIDLAEKRERAQKNISF